MPTDNTIKGQVTDQQSGQGVPNLQVEAWAKIKAAGTPGRGLPTRQQKLGAGKTNAGGRFAIKLSATTVARVEGQIYFKVYDAGEDLIQDTRDQITWDPGHPSEVHLKISTAGTDQSIATGTVTHRTGVAVPKLVVKAFHKALGKEETLGQAVTDDNGKFTVRYPRRDTAPDLFVRVYPPASSMDKDKALAVSGVRFNAKPEESFELEIDASRYRGPSEFGRLAAVLTPLLKNAKLEELTAEDVALLSGKTQQNHDHVTRFIAAGIMAQQSGLAHEAIYGLLRRGFGPPLNQLLAHDGPALAAALEQASGENVVSLEIGGKATELVEKMGALQLERAAEIASGTIGELLAVAGLDGSREADRKKAAALILAHRRGKDLWSAFRAAGFDGPTIKSIRLAIELGQVTAGHVPLVKAAFNQDADKRPEQLADIAWYSEQRWEQLFDAQVDGKPVGIPDFVAGKTPKERRANYVQFLFAILEAATSTAAIGAAMERSNSRQKVRDFLKEYQDFDFAASHVGTFLKKNDVARGDDLKPELEKLQRAYRIAPIRHRYEVMDALLAQGFDSAHKVARLSQSSFLKRIDRKLSKEQAIAIYRKARLYSSLALTTYVADAQGQIQPGLRVLPPWRAPWEQDGAGASVPISGGAGSGGGAVAADDEAGRLADYRTLFGSLDYCACEHCRSVLSPAAYFVDLLHWLSRDREDPTPLQTLLGRRPDLETLQLSCENTDTLVPYVDLVNEVLENAVAALNGEAVVSHDVSVPHSEELLSTPQYVNAVAYDILADSSLAVSGSRKPAVYPASLPFDLWGTQARVFLKQLGVERWKLMEAFARVDDPSRLEIATELLGMSTGERDLIINTTADPRLWGYDSDTAWSELCHVPTFLQRVGFTNEPGKRFVQLLDLLHTEAANPERKIGLLPDPEPGEQGDICDLSQLVLRKDGGALEAADFHRIQRFVRLWRRLGWSMLELDKALSALNKEDNIDEEAIKSLADVRHIQTETQIDLLPLLSWWAKVDIKNDRDGKPEAQKVRSLYEEGFLNPALGESVISVFRSVISPPPTPVPGPPPGGGGPGTQPPVGTSPGAGGPGTPPPTPSPQPPAAPRLAEVEAEIQAAMGITAEDLGHIKAMMFVDDNGDDIWSDAVLDLANLSTIYRVVTLAQALKTPIKDALNLRALTAKAPDPVDPFANTAQAKQFIDEVRDIRKAGFSVSDLLYLLAHEAEATLQLGPGQEQMALTLADLRTGLQRIRDELTLEVDPTGERTQALLRQVPEHSEDHIPDDVLAELIDVIAGVSKLAPVDQTALVENQLDAFLDPAEAVAKLVNNGIPVAETSERFHYVQSAVTAYLADYRGERLVEQSLATVVDMEVRSAADLLKRRLRAPSDPDVSALSVFLAEEFVDRKQPIGDTRIPDAAGVDKDLNPEDQKDAWTVLVRLHKTAFLFKRLNITFEAQAWLFEYGVGWGLLDPLRLPIDVMELASAADLYPAWKKLADFFRLNDRIPGVRPSLSELSNILVANVDDWRVALCERTGWSPEDLEYLLDVLPHATAEPLHDPAFWHRLTDCFEILGRVAKPAEEVDQWRTAKLTRSSADAVRMAVRSRYEHTRWLEVAKQLQDQLREQQRTALVAYLVAHEDGVHNANDLYGKYLIDVETSPCATTSRIKQAISSVQLFVQRCFLGLEDEHREIALDEHDARQWKWRGHYRVWEANRKVFLYPENWIYPELRRDKSQFFEELESELLQNEITEATIESAYLSYLEKLNLVARLDVRALYHQKENDADSDTDILHVFGRTPGLPHTYYYRQHINGARWTPWERVDVDLEGEHLVPVVHNHRLMLFWPTFAEQDESSDNVTRRRLKVQLAWSERSRDNWSPKTVCELGVSGPQYPSSIPSLWYEVTSHPTASGLEIHVTDHIKNVRCAVFVYRSCDGTVRTAQDDTEIEELDLISGRMFYARVDNWYRITDLFRTGSLAVFLSASFLAHKQLIKVLNGFREVARVTYPRHYEADEYWTTPYWRFDSQHPFALADSERTFLVVPECRLVMVEEIQSSNVLQYMDVAREMSEARYRDAPMSLRNGVLEEDIAASGVSVGFTTPPVSSSERADAMKGFMYLQGGKERVGTPLTSSEFHRSLRNVQNVLNDAVVQSREPTWLAFLSVRYKFTTFYHPFVCTFITEVRRHGIDGLLAPSVEGVSAGLSRQQLRHAEYFETDYKPSASVLEPYPFEDIDFAIDGAYSSYNWELFFHAPFLLASRLSQDQRFEEAMRWFHYIFEPMSRSAPDDMAGNTYARYWKVKPFIDEPDPPIHQLLQDSESRQRFVEQVRAWEEQPFDPHLIAYFRPVAYQKAVVIKYLDNIIAWGDQLFRQDSIEAINQATQLYSMAAEILGPRPETIPPFAKPPVRDFKYLQNGGLDEFSNVLEQIEILLAPISGEANGANSDALPDLGPILYFGIPQNVKLVEYWNTIEDRLFKIRHCMNIEGIARELPLFQPPIDPGLLVRAAAAGVDLSSVLTDLNAPLPHYRFNVMLEKAKTLNATVRALGGALLSALEKRDAEQIALLRSTHEQNLLKAVREVRRRQVDESEEALEGIRRSQSVVQARHLYYRELVENGLNDQETEQFAQLKEALKWQLWSARIEMASSILSAGPQLTYTYPGQAGLSWGTLQLANVFSAISRGFAIENMVHSYYANKASIKGGHKRRADEWEFQLEIAEKELAQMEKQVLAGEIRLAIAEKEKDNQDLQIENAEAIDTWMRDKFTNKQLYDWMVTQLSTLYFQSYQLAYDLAKRAQRCYQHELARPGDTFIQYGHWDSLKKGLLAGDRLQYDLERLEAAYLENDRREYELTKHVSLVMVNPVALIKLRQTGSCEFEVPEAFFDLDQPGNYMRRIKSVSLSIPAVTGPYTGIDGMLVLESSRIRRQPQIGDDGLELEPGVIETVAISGGQNDTGLFELSHNDPRYLPFERRGAVSHWKLELTSALPEFDRQTITDVILHLRYTAREGGEIFRTNVKNDIKSALNKMTVNNETGLMQIFSARHHFPNVWYEFLNPGPNEKEQKLAFKIGAEHFPYLVRDGQLNVHRIDILLLLKDPSKFQPGTELGFAFTIGSHINPGTDDERTLTTKEEYGSQPYATFGLNARFDLATSQELGAVEFVPMQDDVANLDSSYLVEPPVVIDGQEYNRLANHAVADLIAILHYTLA